MADNDLDVALRLRLQDAGASAGLKAVSDAAQKDAAKAGTATERAAQKAAQAAEQSATRARNSYQRAMQAREQLGIRAERTIQREIAQTEAAYRRLAATGTMGWREQARAADAMRAKVRELTNEMGRLTAAQKAGAAVRGIAVASAGVAAAAYTVKGPMSRVLSYDDRLASMANTAFAERDASGRIQGMAQLDAAVNRANRAGGGTREQAADALDAMIASGTVSNTDAMAMLPGIMKAATAANTNANDLATIAIRAKQSFGIKATDIPAVLSAALAAGQAGGFELKDMAKWLPQQMAMASNLGITGKDSFAKLAAWNQASVITAGTKDEAGNNMRDLLNELNTPHFRNFIATEYLANGKKAKPGERAGRMSKMDDIFLDYQRRGINKVDATVDIMDQIFSKNQKYQSLSTELQGIQKSAPKGEYNAEQIARRQEILGSMEQLVKGTAIGNVFHNQQSLMAILGLMNNREYVQEVLKKTRGEYSAAPGQSQVDIGFDVRASRGEHQMQQADNALQAAQKAALDPIMPVITKVAQGFTEIANEYPKLVGATELGVAALAAFAGAVGFASIAMGGKGLSGGSAISRASALMNTPMGRGVAKFGKSALVFGGLELASEYALNSFTAPPSGTSATQGPSAINRYGTSALQYGAVGATLGSFLPGAGTLIGGGVGLGVGVLWQGIQDIVNAIKSEPKKPIEVNTKVQVELAPELRMRGQQTQVDSASQSYPNTGNMFIGAP